MVHVIMKKEGTVLGAACVADKSHRFPSEVAAAAGFSTVMQSRIDA